MLWPGKNAPAVAVPKVVKGLVVVGKKPHRTATWLAVRTNPVVELGAACVAVGCGSTHAAIVGSAIVK
ncbi:MAG: hypothetical protein K6U89_20330 [Chloroflexi bacterium]|nr:hypothetical protein [Chloroflexota bacterium]